MFKFLCEARLAGFCMTARFDTNCNAVFAIAAVDWFFRQNAFGQSSVNAGEIRAVQTSRALVAFVPVR